MDKFLERNEDLVEDDMVGRVATSRARWGRLHSQTSRQSRDSVDSNTSTASEPYRSVYRVIVMGAGESGKTSIISQFLYDRLPSVNRETVEDMYRGDFDVGGMELSLNIQDTGGSYTYDFPSMVSVSLYSADAVVLVFAVNDPESFEEVVRLRDMVIETKGFDTPIVIVGNKTDMERKVPKEEVEATVIFDWENGYVECSAKENKNIVAVFKELLVQSKVRLDSTKLLPGGKQVNSTNLIRRQSMPLVPAFQRMSAKFASLSSPSPKTKRRSSLAMQRKDNCRIS